MSLCNGSQGAKYNFQFFEKQLILPIMSHNVYFKIILVRGKMILKFLNYRCKELGQDMYVMKLNIHTMYICRGGIPLLL